MNLKDLQLIEPSFPGMCPITEAVDALAHSTETKERGAIFTRGEVVDFVLDLVGYTASKALYEIRLLEPSFGEGDFLLPAIERLLSSVAAARKRGTRVPPLDNCIRGVELHKASYEHTRGKVTALLQSQGVSSTEAERLSGVWLVHGDFLLVPLPSAFDVTCGNPPYLRQEEIPAVLLQEYKRRYSTIFDRADLYVPFIERCLRLLDKGGKLSFICADRWMKNRYGGPLRALIARDYHVSAYVDMADVQAFHSDVIAYPAITVIERAPAGATLVASSPSLEPAALKALAKALRGEAKPLPAGVHRLEGVAQGEEPWVFQQSRSIDLVRRIEAEYPVLEDAGCKVGIGVATGADGVYVRKMDDLDVEPERKLPLVMTRDIASGRVEWRGYGVLNPFEDDGSLVSLARYPRFAKYLEAHRDAIVGRHVAKRDSAKWYRTIDRITAPLAMQPKLLIPDIKGEAHVVYEEGHLYPHHNLYYVVSDEWDLRALQGILLSDLTRLFVATYSTKMRGGFLRFQAQYLRRLRVPRWPDVSPTMRQRLIAAAESLDVQRCNQAVAALYHLTPEEQQALQEARDGPRTGRVPATS